METMNMLEVNIEAFTRQIKEEFEDDIMDPMIGIGKSGVGKTMSIYELTKELGIGFCEIRLVNMTEIDLIGIPDKDEYNRTTYLTNTLLPIAERDGERGILVLDEITSCSSTVRASAYQLLDSKRALGNYKLPDGWKVVALGNGIDDGGVFQGAEAALFSRCMCYRVEPDFDVWKKWAINNGVNSSVIAYLSYDPTRLHVFDPDQFAGVFPCPRSWVALSKRLNSREKRGKLEPLQIEMYAAGAVGAEEAPRFCGFYEYNNKAISVLDIIDGKLDGSEVKDADSQVIYILIQSLVKYLREMLKGYSDTDPDKDEKIAKVANVCSWIVNAGNFRLDYAITLLTDITIINEFSWIVTTDDRFDELCPTFLEFCSKNNVVLNV